MSINVCKNKYNGTTITTIKCGRLWFWQIGKLLKLRKKLGWQWWQNGLCSYDYPSMGITIEYIAMRPLWWRCTLAHEKGHAKLIADNRQLGYKYVDELNEQYDAWNLHGLLFWRNDWRNMK